jgi:hypothetical protein
VGYVRRGRRITLECIAIGLTSSVARLGTMTPRAGQQIDLVLRHEVNERTHVLKQRLQSVYSKHSAAGRLQSGATIKVALRIMDELACDAVDCLSEKVLRIARDPEAYNLFQLAIADLIEFLRDEMPTVVRMASGRLPCDPIPSIETAAYGLFDELQSKIETKLEILAFNFEEPTGSTNGEPAAANPKPTKSGRPPASFWDDMWAAIACDLYVGTLKPRTQAEVEQAMLTWIEDHGFTAATSTVRARARRLWDRLETQR